MQSNRISGQIFSDTITDSDLTVTNENPTITNRNEFRNSRVLIIGLGQLGLPVAKYVKEKGFDTYGYDIEQKAIERQQKDINKRAMFSDFAVYMIGTPISC